MNIIGNHYPILPSINHIQKKGLKNLSYPSSWTCAFTWDDFIGWIRTWNTGR